MDNSREIFYKTLLSQRQASYKYIKHNREKLNEVYNKYNKKNQQYGLY